MNRGSSAFISSHGQSGDCSLTSAPSMSRSAVNTPPSSVSLPTSVTRAVVVLGLPGLELLDSAVARRPTAFPYVPGLLSLRELPAVLDDEEDFDDELDFEMF